MKRGCATAGYLMRRSRIEQIAAALAIVTIAFSLVAAFAVRSNDTNIFSDAGITDTTPGNLARADVSAKGTAATSGQQAQRVETEVVTIRPTGFEPKEITRPKGLFVLAVENRSGLQAIELRLDRQAGPRLKDVPMPRNKHDWNDGFDLTPGQYVLTEANHPDWSCSITITAR